MRTCWEDLDAAGSHEMFVSEVAAQTMIDRGHDIGHVVDIFGG